MRKVLIPLVAVGLVTVLVLTASDSGDGDTVPDVDLETIATGEVIDVGQAPSFPTGSWSPEVTATLDSIVASLGLGVTPQDELDTIAASRDPRLAWALADLLNFLPQGDVSLAIQNAIGELLGQEIDPFQPWNYTIQRLIAWDAPVPPEYFVFKRDFYGQVDPRWTPLLHDVNTIDWRLVGWGGVFIDDRPAGSTARCNCIPALDDPPVTPAVDGAWYPDDRIVFGIVVDGEARAYPKNQMEVHEMVNDTVGGRRIALPYCTLCGSAQAYYTDAIADRFDQPVLRTSGLLSRSNKMMYDLTSQSFVDTFTGVATAGPLLEGQVVFEQLSVVTATWGDWKTAHPDTTIVAADGGLDRTYELDPLGGRDDNGPIFPVGPVDPRLPVQEPVLGIRTAAGEPVAVHVETARRLLADGDEIIIDDITLVLDGGGVRAVRDGGDDAAGHQSFWFAWSQFWPGTKLWPHDWVDG